ncbi:MAG: hypothetical protein ACRDHM_07420 [Actinomycetota bacterium]
MSATVRVEGLTEFRSALRASIQATPRELTRALKRAGDPILAALRGIPAHRSGALAGGYRARARGTTAEITNVMPYGAGAEWGARGKWKGFLRYGGPGRFAARKVDEKAEETMLRVSEELEQVIMIQGWAS